MPGGNPGLMRCRSAGAGEWMLDSPIVDVAMGLAFFYVTLSLVCSSIQEIIAGVFGLRS